MPLIKNIAPEEALSLATQVQIQPGQIVSKTLAQNTAVSMALFAFDEGEEISAHSLDEKPFELNPGETIMMPAGKPHAVFALKSFKMLLTVIFPQETK